MATPPQAPVQRTQKWRLAASIAGAVLVLGGISVYLLLPSDEALAERAASQLGALLGVPVSVGSLHWQLKPGAVVTLENIATQQAQPITIQKLTAQLDIAALWRQRLKIDRLEVDGAVLPQLSLRALQAPSDQPVGQGTSRLQLDELPLAALVFRDATWVSRYAERVVYDGEAEFDAAWRPRTASLRRPGVQPAANLTLTRQGNQDRWDTRINVGGGTANGDLQLQPTANGQLHLTGKLQPRGIDAVSALAAFNRRSVMAGKVAGETTLSAHGTGLAGLARTLHTATPFSVSQPMLLRFDLEKAIRSAGKDHAGKTPLNTVSGQLDTQNTADGMVLDFSRVKAQSGALTASGKARIANRQIDAELNVDLIDGLVGVPLKLSGPLARVSVSVPPAALAGAAVGTAVLPGVGTAIGARIGAALRNIFNTSPARPTPPDTSPPKR